MIRKMTARKLSIQCMLEPKTQFPLKKPHIRSCDFRLDYKSCRVGVVVVDVRRLSFVYVLHLWKLCDYVTYVILEL